MRTALRALAFILLAPIVAGAQVATPEQNLKRLNILLPSPAAPLGTYVPAVGVALSRDEGYQAARTTGLSPADIAAIRATSDRWFTAVRAGRWADAAATFTTDAVLRFGVDVYEGRAAIQTFHESMPPFDKTRVLHIDEIEGRGDMAFVAGHSTIVPDGGGMPVVVARYIDIRLRQPDGTWLFYRDVVTPVPR